ncbi:MAG: TIGR04282 family arsenosugar biosynthesis glycosyltransferase [Bryobacteraceae bacterium]
MRPVIIVFAKAPVPGQVKTRLAARIGAPQAAALHDACVRDTLEKLLALDSPAEVELHTDICTDAWRDYPVTQRLQLPGNLGVKMFGAMASALERGCRQVCIVGSDSPALPAQHLLHLLSLASDVALAPCDDGGYYAIACRRTDPLMFDGVAWSSPTALADTERAALACGLSVERGIIGYDVDEYDDLVRLAGEPSLPQHTRRCLERLLR